MAKIPVEEVAVLLLHLFIREPSTSPLLKHVMKHVCGPFLSSATIHRISQVREHDQDIIFKEYSFGDAY
jgi:hypothetical protein